MHLTFIEGVAVGGVCGVGGTLFFLVSACKAGLNRLQTENPALYRTAKAFLDKK